MKEACQKCGCTIFCLYWHSTFASGCNHCSIISSMCKRCHLLDFLELGRLSFCLCHIICLTIALRNFLSTSKMKKKEFHMTTKPVGRKGRRGLILITLMRAIWNEWLKKQINLMVDAVALQLVFIRNNTQQSCLGHFQNTSVWKYGALLKDLVSQTCCNIDKRIFEN